LRLFDTEWCGAIRFLCDYGNEEHRLYEDSGHLFRDEPEAVIPEWARCSASHVTWLKSPSRISLDGKFLAVVQGEEYDGLLLMHIHRRQSRRLLHLHDTLLWHPVL